MQSDASDKLSFALAENVVMDACQDFLKAAAEKYVYIPYVSLMFERFIQVELFVRHAAIRPIKCPVGSSFIDFAAHYTKLIGMMGDSQKFPKTPKEDLLLMLDGASRFVRGCTNFLVEYSFKVFAESLDSFYILPRLVRAFVSAYFSLVTIGLEGSRMVAEPVGIEYFHNVERKRPMLSDCYTTSVLSALTGGSSLTEANSMVQSESRNVFDSLSNITARKLYTVKDTLDAIKASEHNVIPLVIPNSISRFVNLGRLSGNQYMSIMGDIVDLHLAMAESISSAIQRTNSCKLTIFSLWQEYNGCER